MCIKAKQPIAYCNNRKQALSFPRVFHQFERLLKLKQKRDRDAQDEGGERERAIKLNDVENVGIDSLRNAIVREPHRYK